MKILSYELKYVYLMRGTKWMYKIGISNDPKRRLKEVAHKPKIVATYRYYNAEGVEKFLHHFFGDSRRTRKGSGKTEWFRLGILELLIVHFFMLFFKIVHDLLILGVLVGIVVAILWVINNAIA